MSRVTPKCSICLETFEANDRFAAIQCGHVMHRHCLRKWFASNGYCPVCKYRPYTHNTRGERQPMDIYLDFDKEDTNTLDTIKDIGKSVVDVFRSKFAKMAATIPSFLWLPLTGFNPVTLNLSYIETELLRDLNWELDQMTRDVKGLIE